MYRISYHIESHSYGVNMDCMVLLGGVMKRTFLNSWFTLDFDGTIRRAQCIDIEFQTGLGPIFLMKTKFGNKFWLTRREIKDHEVIN